jgi:hypothetical protein
MSFRIRVLRVNHLASVGLHILDCQLEPDARVFVGSEGVLASNPSRRIKITGIAIRTFADGSHAITIAPPDFPLSELEGGVIVGD